MLSCLGKLVQHGLVKLVWLPEGTADSIFEDLTRCWLLFWVYGLHFLKVGVAFIGGSVIEVLRNTLIGRFERCLSASVFSYGLYWSVIECRFPLDWISDFPYLSLQILIDRLISILPRRLNPLNSCLLSHLIISLQDPLFRIRSTFLFHIIIFLCGE